MEFFFNEQFDAYFEPHSLKFCFASVISGSRKKKDFQKLARDFRFIKKQFTAQMVTSLAQFGSTFNFFKYLVYGSIIRENILLPVFNDFQKCYYIIKKR